MCAALKIGRGTSGTYFSWRLSCGSLERALVGRSDVPRWVCARAHLCVRSLCSRGLRVQSVLAGHGSVCVKHCLQSSSFLRPVRSMTVEGDVRGCVGSRGRA